MKFGVLKYEYGINANTLGSNLGDEIQSIAASYFLPQVDYYIDREGIAENVSQEKLKLIMNGWYMHDWTQWPPASNIDPLLVSIHLANKKFEENLFSPQNLEYLISHGPIGARDLNTLDLLQEQNIPAYFSGCLTLTLPKNENIVKEDYILCIDVQKEIVEKLKKHTSRKIYEFSTNFSHPYLNCTEKFKYALSLLNAYQSAAGVITSRLHAAMPCLALNTPVLLVRDAEDFDGRFGGLSDLVRKIDNKSYLDNIDYFDVNNLTPNSDDYMKYRKSLIERCEAFTGQKHRKTTPIVEMKSLEEQLVSNIEIVHNMTAREDEYKFSHWYFRERLGHIQKHLHHLK